MFKKITEASLLLSLSIIIMISTSTALTEKSIFNELSQNQLSELSDFYQKNPNATAFKIYNQSKELSIKYPFYSYSLALKCSEAILEKNINDLAIAKGINTTIENLTETIGKGIDQHQEEVFRFRQNSKSFASEEWLSLAEKDLNLSRTFFNASQTSYNQENYNATLAYLAKSNFSLYSSNKLLKIAEYRNDTSSIYDMQNDKNLEKITISWIENAKNEISLLEGAEKRKDILKIAKGAFNDSNRYYSNENHYLSLMSAAEAYALAGFGLGYEKYAGSTEAMKKSEKQIGIAENSLAEIYEKYDVDAPLAEMHLEMARIRLEDAKNSGEINVIPLSDMAINEAMIAEKQTKAVMDFMNAQNPVESVQSPQVMQTPFGIMPMIGIIIAAYISRRK